ncbi:inositol monophosphatase [Chromatiales bacterium (ex Bugula neritina AB1)]|nr:inositol monophosphatase [Chromatiales bacterium (ex Bugula neritina AB1)]
MSIELTQRQHEGLRIVLAAATTAHDYFRDIDSLEIEEKGVQDFVSNADKAVETQIRTALLHAFPDDGIIGEEHGNIESESGYTWLIDPIDGTANFINGIPGWCVVASCVKDCETLIGIVRDAIADETFVAVKGKGTTLNGKPVRVATSTSLANGSVGVGHSTRVEPELTIAALGRLLNAGGVFYRNASGALMLSYVASGRLTGYCEPHMNAWDCLASLLMISEAGGITAAFDMQEMLTAGSRVITACPGIYTELLEICEASY